MGFPGSPVVSTLRRAAWETLCSMAGAGGQHFGKETRPPGHTRLSPHLPTRGRGLSVVLVIGEVSPGRCISTATEFSRILGDRAPFILEARKPLRIWARCSTGGGGAVQWVRGPARQQMWEQRRCGRGFGCVWGLHHEPVRFPSAGLIFPQGYGEATGGIPSTSHEAAFGRAGGVC